MSPYIKTIRPDDWHRIRRGRYVIVTGGKPRPMATPFGIPTDEDGNILMTDDCPIGGLVVRVTAAAPPYVGGKTVSQSQGISANTTVLLDLRKYTLGFVTKKFAERLAAK